MVKKFNHLKHVFDKYIFVLLVSKIFSLCSKSRPHRPALHRTLVTLNNTFHQLIPSKKYIALHISFFFLALCSLNAQRKKNFGGYYWWWLSVKAKAEKSLPRGHENTHWGHEYILESYYSFEFWKYCFSSFWYVVASIQHCNGRNIWFLSPFVLRETEEAKTKYSAP